MQSSSSRSRAPRATSLGEAHYLAQDGSRYMTTLPPMATSMPHHQQYPMSGHGHQPMHPMATGTMAHYSNSYSTLSNFDGSMSTQHMPGSQMPIQQPRLPPLTLRDPSGYPLSSSPSSQGQLPSPKSPSSSTKMYRCEQCNQAFTRAHDKKRHLSTHNRDPESGPKCGYCFRHFSRGDALKRHLDNGCDSMPEDEYQLRQRQQRLSRANS